MNIIKVVYKVLLYPKEFFKNISADTKQTLIYMLTLNAIGPSLSFYSMYFSEGIPLEKTVLYAISTYVFDIFSILIFSLLIFLMEKEKSFSFYFSLSVFVYTPIWIGDISDINQYLRPLSNIGFLYSIYLLFVALNSLKMKKIKAIMYIFVFITLYILDALCAEMIVQNPWVKKILR